MESNRIMSATFTKEELYELVPYLRKKKKVGSRKRKEDILKKAFDVWKAGLNGKITKKDTLDKLSLLVQIANQSQDYFKAFVLETLRLNLIDIFQTKKV